MDRSEVIEDAKAALAGWLPMSLAPKDGRRILGYDREHGRYVVEWSDMRDKWLTVPVSLERHEPTLWAELPSLPSA